jgi:hypothetical protein
LVSSVLLIFIVFFVVFVLCSLFSFCVLCSIAPVYLVCKFWISLSVLYTDLHELYIFIWSRIVSCQVNLLIPFGNH